MERCFVVLGEVSRTMQVATRKSPKNTNILTTESYIFCKIVEEKLDRSIKTPLL